MNVAQSLYKRAIGYKYTETKTFKDEEDQILKTVTDEKEQAPDVMAALKWLAMRQKALWADIAKSELSVKHEGQIQHIAKELQKTGQYSMEDLKGALTKSLEKVRQN